MIKQWNKKASFWLKYILKMIPDKVYLKIVYRIKMGRSLNLLNPTAFNEKLQWLKLYDRNPIFIQLVDKYAVREFVKEKIGEQHLVPLIGIYDNVEDIPFDRLPQNYVLKCTHDSGSIIIKNSDSMMSVGDMKQVLKDGISRSYYYNYREWPYKHVKPRIICESLINTGSNKLPNDIKIFCFNGEPQFLFVASDRGYGTTKFDFFDLNWNRIPVKQYYPNSEYDLKKPKQWSKMLECARRLSEDFIHVRVDFYVDIEENILFGEMTFYHFSGFVKFEPREFDELFGKFIRLPIC